MQVSLWNTPGSRMAGSCGSSVRCFVGTSKQIFIVTEGIYVPVAVPRGEMESQNSFKMHFSDG